VRTSGPGIHICIVLMKVAAPEGIQKGVPVNSKSPNLLMKSVNYRSSFLTRIW